MSKIVLPHDGGTIDAMCWLRDNNCPSLSCQVFGTTTRETLIISSITEEDVSSTLDCIALGIYTWHNYKGLKRVGNPIEGWTFDINGKYYFCSRI